MQQDHGAIATARTARPLQNHAAAIDAGRRLSAGPTATCLRRDRRHACADRRQDPQPEPVVRLAARVGSPHVRRTGSRSVDLDKDDETPLYWIAPARTARKMITNNQPDPDQGQPAQRLRRDARERRLCVAALRARIPTGAGSRGRPFLPRPRSQACSACCRQYECRSRFPLRSPPRSWGRP